MGDGITRPTFFNMATMWTELDVSKATNFIPLEPGGFGYMPFGDPTSGVEDGIKIHIKGFGDPLTAWSATSVPATTWSAV